MSRLACLKICFAAWGAVLAVDIRADVRAVSSFECEQLSRQGLVGDGVPVGCNRLSVINFDFWQLDGQSNFLGELLVLDVAAMPVLAVMQALRTRGVRLVDAAAPHYCGQASSCKGYAVAFDGLRSADLELGYAHAAGVALSLGGAQQYVPTELCQLMAWHGLFEREGSGSFAFGDQPFVESLLAMPVADARRLLELRTERYRQCFLQSQGSHEQCVAEARDVTH